MFYDKSVIEIRKLFSSKFELALQYFLSYDDYVFQSILYSYNFLWIFLRYYGLTWSDLANVLIEKSGSERPRFEKIPQKMKKTS